MAKPNLPRYLREGSFTSKFTQKYPDQFPNYFPL